LIPSTVDFSDKGKNISYLTHIGKFLSLTILLNYAMQFSFMVIQQKKNLNQFDCIVSESTKNAFLSRVTMKIHIGMYHFTPCD